MNSQTGHAAVPDAALQAALAALCAGDAIGLPTETVYGLAADATRADAVRRIFAIKGRPADHPLIVHLADASWLDDWAIEIPPEARTLAQTFWPGPLTLILKRAPQVLDLVTGSQSTIGVRVPSHPVAQAVLRAFGKALAAPSANRFGHVSPTRAQHVRDEFGDVVPVVLEGGDCEVGIESTIVDLSSAAPRVLRPGRISVAQLEAAIGLRVAIGSGTTGDTPRVSGSLESHYAPSAVAELVRGDALVKRLAEANANGETVRVIAYRDLRSGAEGHALPPDPRRYAHDLYASLRALDAPGVSRILIEAPPDDASWAAVNDRLARATARRE